jgi:uncharacterized protein (TIGR03435 family)
MRAQNDSSNSALPVGGDEGQVVIPKFLSAIRAVVAPSLINQPRRSMLFAIVAGTVVFGLVNAARIRAQAQVTTEARRPSFEVASIKLHRPELGGGAKTQPLPGARLRVENQPVRTLIEAAYKVRDFELFGGPGWIKSDRYDIDAKGEGNPPLPDVVGPMLQGLLEERFKLRVHREQRELPLYVMSAAKRGLTIQPSQQGSCIPYDPNYKPTSGEKHPAICGNIGIGRNLIEGTSIRMADLTRSLALILSRPVLDETGFDKVFDVNLTFAPNDSSIIQPGAQTDPTPPLAVNNDSAGPSLFTALQEQLGLKLESTKGPVEVLVIDHVEKPSEN